MTQTNVKRIYWEEDPEHGDERMVFELEDGRKMELAVYAGSPYESDDVITDVQFKQI